MHLSPEILGGRHLPQGVLVTGSGGQWRARDRRRACGSRGGAAKIGHFAGLLVGRSQHRELLRYLHGRQGQPAARPTEGKLTEPARVGDVEDHRPTGAALRERRKALELTLADMVKKTGLSMGYLSQIELGKNAASIETLYRISLGLRVRVADLFQAVQMPL